MTVTYRWTHSLSVSLVWWLAATWHLVYRNELSKISQWPNEDDSTVNNNIINKTILDTAGCHRPQQDIISSNILGTSKVQAAVNHEMNPSKAITSLFKFNFDLPVFNFT